MQVWMLWHGGSSYAHGNVREDTEHFETFQAAKDAFINRAGWDPYYPCVSDDEPENGGPSAWIFFADPNEDHPRNYGSDPYPDRVLEFGPRGGLRVQYA